MSEFRIGNYKVLGTLGTGAHSSILHVVRAADSKQYALKVVNIESDDDLKYFDQAELEFKVSQKLDHPNIIKIYALETQKDWRFRVRKVQTLIEYVNGLTLDNIKQLAMPHLVQIFVHIASAMVHMHRRGICHADLKPNNLMISKANQVKIIDFGLARMKGSGKSRVQGTPEYMAPEQAKHGFVNEQTDIYNFGATMYRLVTWQLPPCPIVDGAVVNAKVWEERLTPVQELNPRVPPELADIVHRCMAFNPHARPERVSEVQGALDHLADKLITRHEDKLEALEW